MAPLPVRNCRKSGLNQWYETCCEDDVLDRQLLALGCPQSGLELARVDKESGSTAGKGGQGFP